MLRERFTRFSQGIVLSFEQETDAVVAEVGQLGLVETGGFDLTLARGRISGSGSLAVSHEDGKSRMRLDARDGEAWTIETKLHDAQLGAMSEIQRSSRTSIPRPEGTISVSKLD